MKITFQPHEYKGCFGIYVISEYIDKGLAKTRLMAHSKALPDEKEGLDKNDPEFTKRLYLKEKTDTWLSYDDREDDILVAFKKHLKKMVGLAVCNMAHRLPEEPKPPEWEINS
jgi:hypothetical protein